MTKNKKKEEKNAYQNWRAIWDGFGDLKDAANKAYSPRLEERLGSRARGMALVEEWLPDVASDPEFNAKAPQNVLDDFYLAGINFLDQKYRGNIQNNWTDILSSLPKDGLASVVLDHLPPVKGIKKYNTAAKSHEMYQGLKAQCDAIEQLYASGHEKKALEMFRDIAIRYLAGHEEKDENGKKKKVPGEIQKNLEKDPDIKVRGDKVVEALTGQYVNACVGALAVVEGSGHRYVNRKLGDYASEFDEAVGKDKEVYARHGIAQLKADEDYEAIGQALGAIKPEKKK